MRYIYGKIVQGTAARPFLWLSVIFGLSRITSGPCTWKYCVDALQICFLQTCTSAYSISLEKCGTCCPVYWGGSWSGCQTVYHTVASLSCIKEHPVLFQRPFVALLSLKKWKGHKLAFPASHIAMGDVMTLFWPWRGKLSQRGNFACLGHRGYCSSLKVRNHQCGRLPQRRPMAQAQWSTSTLMWEKLSPTHVGVRSSWLVAWCPLINNSTTKFDLFYGLS